MVLGGDWRTRIDALHMTSLVPWHEVLQRQPLDVPWSFCSCTDRNSSVRGVLSALSETLPALTAAAQKIRPYRTDKQTQSDRTALQRRQWIIRQVCSSSG